MKTRIALDVDNVLRNFTKQIWTMAGRNGVNINPKPENYEFLDQEVNGRSIKHWIWTDKSWLEPVFVDAPIIEKAKSGYELFCTDPQFEVYIVSSQRKNTEQYTDRWLLKNGFKSHVKNIYEFNKLKAPCQVLIDDKNQNVQAYNDNQRMGIIIDHEYNRNVQHPYRVKNLIEAYNLLK